MKGPEVKGFRILEKKLGQLGTKMRGKTARKALRIAMAPVRAEVRRNTPVDTGNAKRLVSLIVLNAKGNLPMAGFVGWRMGRRHRRKGRDPFYIQWHEFGTDNAWGRGVRIPASRMLTRAGDKFLQSNGRSIELLKRQLIRDIRSVARNGGA